MRIYDVSLPISPGLPAWPGDPVPEVEPVSSIPAGNGFNVSALRLSSHTGTHVDAPRHIFADGDTVDRLPLETLIGDAWVCRLRDSVHAVTAAELDRVGIPPNTRRLLLATRNGKLWDRPTWSFSEEYVALSADAAEWVVARGIALLGIDYLSIDRPTAREPAAHRILLSAGVVVVEGLDLRTVPPGGYQVACLPLRLEGGDGAPARVVLLRQ